MYETTYGTKYEATKDLSRVEIAKLIRADIKAAVKAGLIPKAKYSVTCSRGTGIDVSIVDVERRGFVLHNPERLRWEAENPHASMWSAPGNVRDRFSPEAEAVLAALKEIWGAYNYDGSDIQSDYFNVRYYGGVQFGWQWADTMREQELLKLRGEQVAADLGLEAAPASNDSDESTQEAWLAAMGVL
jgi:hypothetical protein